MTVWHCQMAVSLDGRIARSDGGVDWLDDYPPDAAAFDAFLSGVDAILMGRATYDAIARMGDWPYPGKATVVLTSRALPDPPAGVTAHPGPLEAVVAAMEAVHGRVWIGGGGVLLGRMMALGRLDILELAVIPVVLGDGVALFPPGTPAMRLTLESGRPWVGGAMWLVYRRASD